MHPLVVTQALYGAGSMWSLPQQQRPCRQSLPGNVAKNGAWAPFVGGIRRSGLQDPQTPESSGCAAPRTIAALAGKVLAAESSSD